MAELLYQGKAKYLYTGPDDHTIVQYFTDVTTADNGAKIEVLPGKGIINAAISEFFMKHLQTHLDTHFIGMLSPREQLVRKLNMFPIEVVIRNIAAGSIIKRLGIEEGMIFTSPILEYYYKNDALGDPLVNTDHITQLGWVSMFELNLIAQKARQINRILYPLFLDVNIKLVDFKLEFGWRTSPSNIMLADEISPDGCRLWDAETNEKMDKDRFRLGLGGEIAAYQEVARRLGVDPYK